VLLDLFLEAVPFAPKRCVHFQEFMADVHDLIERARKRAADPIRNAAEEIAASAALLCFDELEVNCRRHDPGPPAPASVHAGCRDRRHFEHFDALRGLS
jgi:hypothetical protein